MADKRYRSGALIRKLKNERQRREKEALSKLKTMNWIFHTCDTTAWCTCASWEISGQQPAGADLIAHAELPISGLSSFQSAPDRPTATTDSYATDPACWGKIDENVCAYWARKGPLA